MWKNEVSSPALRQLPEKTNEKSHAKGGTTRKKDIKSRIPWWPELLNKKKDHNVGIESTEEEHHEDETTNEDIEKVLRR